MWRTYQNGITVGTSGSEKGTIVLDEEFDASGRITLERDTQVASFTITCGMYGWFVHTRFFSSGVTAREEYTTMRAELARIAEMRSSGVQEEVTDAISTFVERFP